MFAKKKDEELKSIPENKVSTAEEVKPIPPEKVTPSKEVLKDLIKLPSQRDVVFNRVSEVVKEKKLLVKKNQPLMEIFNDELLELLYLHVSSDFSSGKAILKDTPANKEKLSDPKKLRVYVKGLCANWLRRDPRLNGDEEFKLN